MSGKKLNSTAKPFTFRSGASSFTPSFARTEPEPEPVRENPQKSEVQQVIKAKKPRAPREFVDPRLEQNSPEKTFEFVEPPPQFRKKEPEPEPEPAPAPAPAPEPVKASKKKGKKAKKGKKGKKKGKAEAPVVAKVTAAPLRKAIELIPDSGEKLEQVKTTLDVDWHDLNQYDEREHLNIVFIGHVDAGKSTISGQIMLLTGQVDERTIAKYEREAKEKNRESWYLAFIMDTNEEERNKGKTVEVGRAHFTTKTKRYTLLDAPGHKNYVPNMIGGTAQADVGVLVISARRGEFETGFDRGGQTREHAMLAKTLGINRLIILVNKMDEATVQWSQERYDEIEKKLSPYLLKWGFKSSEFDFIPCSGYTGANLKNQVPEDVCAWYQGPTLMDHLDQLEPIKRDFDAPLRIPVLARYKERGSTMILGKIECGTMVLDKECILTPSDQKFTVVGITVDEKEVPHSFPGENGLIAVKGIEEEQIQPGMVISYVGEQPKCSAKFDAQIIITDLLPHKPIITSGYTAVLHIHTNVIDCQVTRLHAEIDRKTGKTKPRKPRFLNSGTIATVRIAMPMAVALEEYALVPQMGRFTIRDEGQTIAIGKVLKVITKSSVA